MNQTQVLANVATLTSGGPKLSNAEMVATFAALKAHGLLPLLPESFAQFAALLESMGAL